MPCGTHTAANGYHFESYLGRPGRLNLKLEECKFHEDSCWVIQYICPYGATIRHTIVPRMGYGVVKLEWISESRKEPAKKIVRTVECKMQQYKKTDIWFSHKCIY